ncbi:MAG TPA: ABC transporter permease [Anaerolineaceae bacterium]|nr:ABC transporter permease [Anaerolineaceae bacterium]HPN51428.1 ABC transporter permease [Anaerolineaceae bacterium]
MNWISVFMNDLRRVMKDRAELVTLFLLPLAFILPISFALGGGDGYGMTAGNHRTELPVINYDGTGTSSVSLIDSLGESLDVEQSFSADLRDRLGLSGDPDCANAQSLACSEKTARALVRRSGRAGMVVIPEGFSTAIEQGQKTTLIFYYDPAGDATRRMQLEGVVKGAAAKISLTTQLNQSNAQMQSLSTFAPEAFRQSLEQQANAPALADQQPAVQFTELTPSSYVPQSYPDTYQQTVPGYTVMYVFFLIAYLNASIREERHFGTFRRLLSTPISRPALLGGKLAAAIFIGMVQVAIMFGMGYLMFGLELGHDWLALFLLTLALVTCATAIGLASGASRISSGILTAPLIIGALLGGCMFPVDLMPSFLRTIGLFMPHTHALIGYQNLMVRGYGLVEVLPQIGILLLFAAVFFFYAVKRFDFLEEA